MNTEQLLTAVLEKARFQPTEDTRAELFELLVDNYTLGTPAIITAQAVCDFLEIDRREFADQIELILRPEFPR